MKTLPLIRKRTLSTWLILGCSVLTLAGCSDATSVISTATPETVPVTTTVSPTPATQPTTTAETQLPYKFPLTGLPTDHEVKTRPYMVMVENAPQARPQTGLDQADIVYEILAEGEITRFVSVFQSQAAEAIGPVRSIRPYFVEIGDALDAIIVHAGWSQDAMDMMAGRNLAHLDEVYGDGAYYWRSTDRKAPHNLYTSVDKMKKGAEARKFRTEWNGPLLTFAKAGQVKLTGAAVHYIQIPYLMGYFASYDYDAAKGVYLRSMEGKPHLDKETGKQLQTKNLLVLESKHQIIDKEGRRIVDVFGPNKGVIFQEGLSQAITWERKNGMLRAYASDGKEVPLLPGNTWVQIVPEGTKLKVE
ncbi:Putative lipoprotein YerB [Paenibacillus allorhizoplanae]|uniref:Lipoprotein YerB n=1 Tax=Paenibacillus allorhizoplanae TaxID=2905648 RepID=A0ABN8H1J5_9BACL|nr:Putative lipoprotein YerB [Paenibacillus allorhizoplanae]